MSKIRDAITAWSKDADGFGEQPDFVCDGVTPIAEAADRDRTWLRGTLRTVTMRPRGGAPALEAELFDGSDVVTVVWLGRRQINGIAPGVSLEVKGRIARYDGVRTIFNPRYELIP
ncbi:OB-fold nucleic acid binding domain-containing protein [Nocardioides nematodiphilus]|uniref:OB-fold nucleic acid binding domain-containing protein n=1 Tax=Nocardioides nematodiphilus TaxID=2849669 RepID=UPI001CD9DE55|nr:OB-fold nucleic acid binding domain-containing protein [Nocardioides nematodiphilus]MCA1982621.1 OB-fold nucleic acid binding domain-containing protein [Nocardioides nematodiphilus]